MLGSIGQVNITVKDLGEAIEFYRDRLVLRFIAQAGPSLAFFDCRGVRLMLSVQREAISGDNSTLYFDVDVDDIEAGVAALAARGVEFDDEPHVIHSADDYELWMSFFKDPSGNTLAIMDERWEYVGQS